LVIGKRFVIKDSKNQPGVAILIKDQQQQPNDYLFLSIFNTFCCFLLIGVVAISFSIKTRESNRSGNTVQALVYSRKAKIFNLLALCMGALILIAYVYISFGNIFNRDGVK
jgi:heme/copper-type cytochrome/quinol oxidase subunit 2